MKTTLLRRSVAVAFAVVTTTGVATMASATTIPKARHQYLADVASYNKAVDTVDARMRTWTSSTLIMTAQRDVQPVISAGEVFQRRLIGQSWPKHVRPAIMRLYMAIGNEDAMLSSIQAMSVFDGGAIVAAMNQAGMVTLSDANVVRHDLGLPLVTS